VHEALEGYYPRHLHAELAAILEKSPDALGDDFIEKVSVVLFVLESAPIIAEHDLEARRIGRAALKRLQRQVGDIRVSLEDLNTDTQFALAQAMFDEFGPSLTDEEAEKLFGSGAPIEHGLKHLNNCVSQLQKLEDLFDSSLKQLGGKGRPRKDYARDAVEGLHRIWVSITRSCGRI